MLPISPLPQLPPPTLLPNVTQRLMLIQLTSTTDMDMADTVMPDGVDTGTHMLESMVPTHTPMLTMVWLLLHLSQLTPISSTPPDSESAPTTLALKYHVNFSNLRKSTTF